MSGPLASARLGPLTSVELLQATFGGLGDDAAKIRARTNADGSVTLFATDRATGWWGRLTGLSSQRSSAREALDGWFKQAFGPKLSAETKAVLDTRLASGELTVGRLKALLAEVAELEAQARPETPGPRAEEIPTDATLQGGKLTLQGETYKLGKVLGSGGFGEVFLATAENGKQVAIKRMHGDARPDEALEEFTAHRRAMGDGRDASHVVGLKGAVMGSGGQVRAIVTEVMAGSADDTLKRINMAETGELLDQGVVLRGDQARTLRLTVLKDMATGLAQLHDSRGVVHRDVKPGNFLTGHDGVTKISDFGTVRPEDEQHGMTLRQGSTMTYRAPEMDQAVRDVRVREYKIDEARQELARIDQEIKATDTRLDHLSEARRQKLEGMVVKMRDGPRIREATSEEIARTQELVQERRLQLATRQVELQHKVARLTREIDTVSISRKADIFSLGVGAIAILKGPGHDKEAVSTGVLRLQTLGPGDTAERDQAFREMGIDSDSDDDRLLRAMLDPDPTRRPDAGAIANTPPLNHPDLGGIRTRKVLAELVSG